MSVVLCNCLQFLLRKISWSYFPTVCKATKSLKASVKLMCVQFYSGVNLKIVFKNTRCIKKFSLLTRTALSFTGSQQSRIIYRANCWDCNGLNGKTIKDGFMIGKPKTSRPSLKMTIPQPLLTTSKPLDITSSGITLIF